MVSESENGEMSGGLELRRPDKKYENHLDTRNIPHFKELLEEWCNEIEEYLNANFSRTGDKDPKGEIKYWRNHMQHLTSITEQLKREDCKNVIALLSTLTGLIAKKSPIHRWRQIDASITDATNEANDNVNWLSTLERFIEPLYSGTAASTIIDTLPELMDSMKMIHTNARYYNTKDRMTNLFSKITDQMISNCKQHIESGKGKDSLWEKDPQKLVRQLESCIDLNEAYQKQYGITKGKLRQMPKGKQFDFDREPVFGNFDLFCGRITKLIEMFSTIGNITSFLDKNIEGMSRIDRDRFHDIKKDFRSKFHDLLNYHDIGFERDYKGFHVKLSLFEESLQQFINPNLNQNQNIVSIKHSLKLLCNKHMTEEEMTLLTNWAKNEFEGKEDKDEDEIFKINKVWRKYRIDGSNGWECIVSDDGPKVEKTAEQFVASISHEKKGHFIHFSMGNYYFFIYDPEMTNIPPIVRLRKHLTNDDLAALNVVQAKVNEAKTQVNECADAVAYYLEEEDVTNAKLFAARAMEIAVKLAENMIRPYLTKGAEGEAVAGKAVDEPKEASIATEKAAAIAEMERIAALIATEKAAEKAAELQKEYAEKKNIKYLGVKLAAEWGKKDFMVLYNSEFFVNSNTGEVRGAPELGEIFAYMWGEKPNPTALGEILVSTWELWRGNNFVLGEILASMWMKIKDEVGNPNAHLGQILVYMQSNPNIPNADLGEILAYMRLGMDEKDRMHLGEISEYMKEEIEILTSMWVKMVEKEMNSDASLNQILVFVDKDTLDKAVAEAEAEKKRKKEEAENKRKREEAEAAADGEEPAKEIVESYDKIRQMKNRRFGAGLVTNEDQDLNLVVTKVFNMMNTNSDVGEAFAGMWEKISAIVRNAKLGEILMVTWTNMARDMNNANLGEILAAMWEVMCVGKERKADASNFSDILVIMWEKMNEVGQDRSADLGEILAGMWGAKEWNKTLSPSNSDVVDILMFMWEKMDGDRDDAHLGQIMVAMWNKMWMEEGNSMNGDFILSKILNIIWVSHNTNFYTILGAMREKMEENASIHNQGPESHLGRILSAMIQLGLGDGDTRDVVLDKIKNSDMLKRLIGDQKISLILDAV